jgi:hypothetical protein
MQKIETLTDYMKDYNENPIHNYDCSEIAEDLKQIDGSGQLCTIKSKIKFTQITVIERGYEKDYDYHTVYVNYNLVYDPNYSASPVPESQYINKLKSLNTVHGLDISYE